MKRFIRLCPGVLLAVGLTACTDKVEKAGPTAPAAAVQASVADVPSGASGGSTVCLSYATKRAAATARLKHTRELAAERQGEESEKLVKKAEAEAEKLAAIAADACN